MYIDDICKLSNAMVSAHVILYADDILLITPSVSALQSLLLTCEKERDAIDMAISIKYTAPRVHITAGYKFCCSLSNAKISFYRALAKSVAWHMKML